MTRTALDWFKIEGNSRNPMIEVSDRPHCGNKCPKHVLFHCGGSVVEICTDQAGLKMIADAIAAHPEDMKRKALAELNEAKRRAKELGIQEEPLEVPA